MKDMDEWRVLLGGAEAAVEFQRELVIAFRAALEQLEKLTREEAAARDAYHEKDAELARCEQALANANAWVLAHTRTEK